MLTSLLSGICESSFSGVNGCFQAPAVRRLLQNWPALKSYFQSIDDCPKCFSKLFQSEDTYSEIKLQVVFNFFVNVGELLHVTTKILEKSDVSIMDSYKSMTMIRNKINQRIQDQYFGNSAKQFLKKITPMQTENDC
jgi:hypothetical protein